MRRTKRLRYAFSVVLVLLGVLLTGCGSDAVPSSSEPLSPPDPGQTGEVRIDFDGRDPMATAPQGAFSVTAVRVNGGAVRLVASHNAGHALEFPAFVDEQNAPGLMLLVKPGTRPLPSPGLSDFSYGADVQLTSEASSANDNGDNVLQRGLAADASQFKLQVDHGIPSCVVQGSEGRLGVKAKTAALDSWLRLRCDRTGNTLRLTVADLSQSGPAEHVYTATGEIGSVTFPATTLLSIGRKVAENGQPVHHQPDQFNGILDSVWVGFDQDSTADHK